jgi:serine/threonine-protein kinase
MSSNPPLNSDDDKTVSISSQEMETRLCPFCGKSNLVSVISQQSYACSHCQKELAHIDFAQNGSIRGIFGWLLAPGDEILDRYKIKSLLGKGGFGAAYLADDLHLSGKHRALKEVPEQLFDEYETSLLSKLDHPAIPDIIERKTVNGMVYLVLKFGGSRTLDSARKNYPDHRIPQHILLPWLRQLCDVLNYLHTQTPPIIHRDLKPGNILLDENERIMLIDFGIAKEAVPQTLTRTLGRAASMYFSPPEQVMGTGTDERADIYALGATFYALLTGQPPPAAHERVAGKELAPPSQLVPDVLPELENAILQALELNMNHRQQSIKEFALGLGGSFGPNSGFINTEANSEHMLFSNPSSKINTNNSAGIKAKTNANVPLQPPAKSKVWIFSAIAGFGLLAIAGFVINKSTTEPKPPAPIEQVAMPPTTIPSPEPVKPIINDQVQVNPTPAVEPKPVEPVAVSPLIPIPKAEVKDESVKASIEPPRKDKKELRRIVKVRPEAAVVVAKIKKRPLVARMIKPVPAQPRQEPARDVVPLFIQ